MSRSYFREAAFLAFISFSVQAHASDAEEKAILIIQRAGGTITRNEKIEGKPLVRIDARFKPIRDSDLEPLGNLKHLEVLDLTGTKVTDAGIKHLAHHKALHTLSVYQTKISDAGLKDISAFKQLKWLDLGLK